MLEIDKEEIGFTPQYPVTLPEQITEYLTNAIIDGRLEDGQRLIENDLQRKFGISRGPIREAFRILEKNGLVSIIPRKGTFIRKIHRKDIEEIFPIIAYLESLAARMAVSNLTLEHTEEMELALSGMTEASKENDLKSYLKYHLDYHKVFINASKNEALVRIIETLRRQAVWFRFSYLFVQESFEYSIPVHREILNLFIKKDPNQVEALVKEHILVALRRFIQLLESSGQDARAEDVQKSINSRVKLPLQVSGALLKSKEISVVKSL